MLDANKNRIFIFDPCFGSLTGHWENYCKRLYQELIERGFQVKVFGQTQPLAGIIEKINFEPLFENSTYVTIQNVFELNFQAGLFIDDFKKVPESEFQDGDVFLFHSIFPQTFLAITQWTKDLINRKKIIVAIFFQFPPSETKKHVDLLRKIFYRFRRFKLGEKPIKNMEWADNNNVRFYQESIADLKPLLGKSHLLMASTEVLSRNFSALLDLPVHYLPMPGEKIPNFFNAEDSIVKESPAKIRIGYFGHSSLEKGGQFLQYLVEQTQKVYDNAEFILHINPNPDTKQYLDAFKNHQYPHVTCYYGHLESNKLRSLIEQVDIILMPYSSKKYATTPSAIFTEAMPLKKIFVIPKNTWAHDEAKKYNAGVTYFDKYNQFSILSALLSAIIDYKNLKSKSEQAAVKFYQENNMKNYIDMVESIVNTAAHTFN